MVLTTQSAEGICADSEVSFQIADTSNEWKTQIVRLATSPSDRDKMGRAARELVISEYSWPARLSAFHRELAARIGRHA